MAQSSLHDEKSLSMHPCKKKKLDFTRPTFNEPSFDFTSTAKRSKIIQSDVSADDESSRDSDLNSIKATDNVHVHLRLRPLPSDEAVPISYGFDENNVILRGNPANQMNKHVTTERIFTFTSVMDEKVDQPEIYERCVRPILSDPFACDGSTFSSYGCSNSGKTHTILGDKSPGIVPRAIVQVFTEYEDHIASDPFAKVVNDHVTFLSDCDINDETAELEEFLTEAKKLNRNKAIRYPWTNQIRKEHDFKGKTLPDGRNHLIYFWISFVEIYNEKIIDLLRIPKGNVNCNRQLKIMSNNGNSYIRDLKWFYVKTMEQALDILQCGLRRVNYAATGVNAHSSRSHTIFTITMISELNSNYEFSSFKFCDLAGAERMKKTGNAGERLKEASGINGSLLVLGRCLEAVQQNQKSGNNHSKKLDACVPVRESKLTLLLQNSLLGREKFIMIVNILPSLEFHEENVNVLHFGSIANQIVVQKSEVRRFTQARYSAFMQHIKSPQMSASVQESTAISFNESTMDSSIGVMTMEEMRKELRNKIIEADCLRESLKKTERELLAQDLNSRNELFNALLNPSESTEMYYKERLKTSENYFEKRIAGVERRAKNKIQQLETYIEEIIEERNRNHLENIRMRKMLCIGKNDQVIPKAEMRQLLKQLSSTDCLNDDDDDVESISDEESDEQKENEDPNESVQSVAIIDD